MGPTGPTGSPPGPTASRVMSPTGPIVGPTDPTGASRITGPTGSTVTVQEQPWHPNSAAWPGVQGPSVVPPQRKTRAVRSRANWVESADLSVGSAAPPDRACFLLDLLLAKGYRLEIRGDLEEEFLTDKFPRYGARRARFWFWAQTVKAIAIRNPVGEWILRKIGS
jgi:hypothetical protein